MTSTLLAMGLVTALMQTQAPAKEIAFQGCVTPGVDRGSYVITGVQPLATDPGAMVIPESAHGRRVLFWLNNDAAVRTNIGRKVEIRGTFAEVEESEIELKAGRQDAGGFIVEFEGPGPDVRSADPSVATAVGTSGRANPDSDDVKTFLMRINVRDVKVVSLGCS
jgi:hypothetical protein